jgi:phage terminase large subunit
MMPSKPANSSKARRAFVTALRRSRAELVPPAFQVLWEVARYIVLYGGRGAAKSWSIARVLITMAHEAPLRVLCLREIQGSIRESAYRLLADQIQLLELDGFFQVQADRIIGKNGSEFYFEGLRYNGAKIRSYEGITTVWVEEAQSVSEFSWETLVPTIRKSGSRFFISFNPMSKTDPVSARFLDNPPDGAIVRKVSWRDNPHLSAETDAERRWLEKTDPDSYKHVWEGHPREASDAQILRGKFIGETFEVQPHWSGPHHGVDYGFARDPSAAVKCYIDDVERVLYVTNEFWQLGADIDALPALLEAAIPGISRHVVYCDSARPETTSYLARNGIPGARSAEKWPGSIDDGVGYLRSFAKIIIDPSCVRLLDECASYSYKCDRLTGAPLPEVEDRHNHLIDSLRYALSPLIRNLPTGGYFNRAALLERGEPLRPSTERLWQLMVTVAICDRPGTAVGAIFWGVSPHYGHLLQVLDYDIVEFDALADGWLSRLYVRAAGLKAEWNCCDPETRVFVEDRELHDVLAFGLPSEAEAPALGLLAGSYDLLLVDGDKFPATLDERAKAIRAIVNAGTTIKLAHGAYTHQMIHRNTTANHLLNQLIGFRPGNPDAPAELLAAFALGVLKALEA